MKKLTLFIILISHIGLSFGDARSDAAEAREEARRAREEVIQAREEARQYRQQEERRRAEETQRNQDKAVFEFMRQTRDKANTSWPE